MALEPIEINKVYFDDLAKGAADVAIVMIYSISKYHEKYKLTSYAMKELEKRGYRKEDLAFFDENWTKFYDTMLNQEDL